MNTRRFIPTEIKNYSPQFFILCLLFFLAFAWAIWNEVESRRPWKSYQREFRKIELSVVEAQLEEAEKNIVSTVRAETGSSGEGLETIDGLKEHLAGQLDELENDDAYLGSLEEIERNKREQGFVTQEIRFARSEADELFYKWKHNLHSGTGFEKYEKDWRAKQSEIEGLEDQNRQLESEIADLQAANRDRTDKIKLYHRGIQELDGFLQNRESRLNQVKNRSPEIRQIVLPAFGKNKFGQPEDRVDRCISCHVAIDRKGFEDQPNPFRTHPDFDYWSANHPFEQMGCTPCHRGQGPALRSAFDAHGYRNVESENGTESGNDREYLEHWNEPMYAGDHIQSSCPLCHRTFEVSGADVLNRSKLLFVELGCHACHYTKDFEDKAKIGPDLKKIMSKVYPEWVIRWLGNPKDYLPKTRMPNYRFSDSEVIAIAAYLNQNSDTYVPAYEAKRRSSIDRGRELVESRGCLGCHSIENHEAGGYLAPMGYDLVPNLTRIAEKVDREWLVDWLVDPKNFRPTTKMPNLSLNPDEANDISVYLLSLASPLPDDEGLADQLNDESLARTGRRLIYDNGCYSCHEIKGFEGASRIAPPLSEFGNKDPTVELYFGDAPMRPDFRLRYGSEIETWDNWTFNKLKDPRIYEDEVSKSKMPTFNLSDDNAHALLILLSSLNGKLAPEKYRRVLTEDEEKIEAGKNLVRTLNCVGCHPINGKGGDIRKFYDDPALAPPDLRGEGDKVQAGWLFRFVKKPFILRPWLRIKMPYFALTDEQASVITSYFNSLSKRKIPFSFFDIETVTDESRSLGRKLFGIRGTAAFQTSLKCGSCHPRGGDLPEGNPADWGPDLSLAAERLKPEWFVDWLRNPQSIQPGTRMPNFFFDYDEWEGEIEITELLPEPERKIFALRDYVMTLE